MSSPTPMTENERPRPRVLIAGAGVAGLFLAILLDRAGIPYEILERASAVKPLGSVLGINANILPVFEQLGIYEEFQEIALPVKRINILYDNLESIASLTSDGTIDLIGYNYEMFCRPAFYQFLLSKISPEKIQFNKKIVSVMQNTEEVVIRCADGEFHYGDILVGADGAHSAVRQSLFDNMKHERTLPLADEQELNIGYTSLVGTTGPLDPVKFPAVGKPHGEQYQVIVQGTQYTWSLFNVRDNRLCYVVVRQYSTKAEADLEKFGNAEWKAETDNAAIEAVRHFKLPFGDGTLTLGDLIDETPRERISRVFLEDKMFETWTNGRTVLVGDAAHKFLPSGAQGAVNAMQDAVILTNCLYDLKSMEHKSIKEALKDYQLQRAPQAKITSDNSNLNATLFFGQSSLQKFIRHVVFHWLPKFLMEKAVIKDASYRPQLCFLPLAATRGSGYVQPQKPSWRYAEEQLKKKEVEASTATTASNAPIVTV
ncbi:hypothetical protein BGZ83_002002 [Gryganskiella cystojenkinii]|nr:hypothetical protein BGZ83_002002 [Gryganskiella cystojenkinii]